MKIIVSGRNVEVTEALKDKVNRKIVKLEKYFKNEETIAHVTLNVEKQRHIVEVTIPFKGIIFRAEEQGEDMYAIIDDVVDVLERQIRKNKTKIEKRMREEGISFGDIEPMSNHKEEPDSKPVKVKKFPVKPMSSEEAVLQMNLIGHKFFVFRNIDTEEVNVVYQRNDGNFGLIIPENL
jgi:putative sigma-54 modulation protein